MKFIKLFICILIITFLSGCAIVKNRDKSDYEACLSACYGSAEYLPSAEDVLNNDKFSYKYYVHYELFGSEGIVVTEELTDEAFEKRKEELMNSYGFLSEPVWDDYTERYVVSEVSFDLNGYSFLVMGDSSTGYDPPKLFGMLAFSAEESKIKYFAFYNQDLDIIDDMTEFVEDEFPRWEK